MRPGWTCDNRPDRVEVSDTHKLVLVECFYCCTAIWINFLGVDGVALLVETDTV